MGAEKRHSREASTIGLGNLDKSEMAPLAIVVEKTIGAVSNANLNADKAVQVDNSELFGDTRSVGQKPYRQSSTHGRIQSSG